MYVDSIVSGYRLIQVPVNGELRSMLAGRSLEELTADTCRSIRAFITGPMLTR
ncbi:MAG: hypothetical protein MZV63_69390 [Marinilabiliales bacterium]|nr:hypothetical protein [Marinilabiliales bacterium]